MQPGTARRAQSMRRWAVAASTVCRLHHSPAAPAAATSCAWCPQSIHALGYPHSMCTHAHCSLMAKVRSINAQLVCIVQPSPEEVAPKERIHLSKWCQTEHQPSCNEGSPRPRRRAGRARGCCRRARYTAPACPGSAPSAGWGPPAHPPHNDVPLVLYDGFAVVWCIALNMSIMKEERANV